MASADDDQTSGLDQAVSRGAFNPENVEFPFRDDVRLGESGQGYALRMAAENHLGGLPTLKTWLHKSRYATLDASDALLLSRWFGASKVHLEHALGRTATGRGDQVFTYAGGQLGRSYFLNRSHPRVCFTCLQSTGQCRLAWDFTLSVACAKHGELLSDTCQHCARSMTWNRRSPAACICQLEFYPEGGTELAAPLELQFANWIDLRIETHAGTEACSKRLLLESKGIPDQLEPLMQLVWPLSLNGGMHITYALATAAGYECLVPSNQPRKRAPIVKAQQILSTANELARRILHLDELQLRVRRPSVVIQLLADCMTGGAPTADRHLAHSLLVTVLQQNRKSRWSGANPQLAQLLLF